MFGPKGAVEQQVEQKSSEGARSFLAGLKQDFASNFLSITSLADAAVMVVSATSGHIVIRVLMQVPESACRGHDPGRKRRVGDGGGEWKSQRISSRLLHNGHQEAWQQRLLGV